MVDLLTRLREDDGRLNPDERAAIDFGLDNVWINIRHLAEDDDGRVHPGLSRPWTDLELSVRPFNCIAAYLDEIGRARLSLSVHELRSMSDRDLLRMKNMGRKSISEVREAIEMFLNGR